MLITPAYGRSSLSDFGPSILAALGVEGETDRIGLNLDGVEHVCLFVVDGMGVEQILDHPNEAPFLVEQLGMNPPLTAGFPSTTAVSLTSIGTGLPSGEHGVMGYLVNPPGHKNLMNSLQWRMRGSGSRDELPFDLAPEQFQPKPTAFERALDAGVAVTHVGPSLQNGSGLTRAGLRGPMFEVSVTMGDVASIALSALSRPGRSLVYAYYGDLDLVGHVRGPGSDAWKFELAQVDLMLRTIAARLPPTSALVVTADHGMVPVGRRVDFDNTTDLQSGVRLLGGEPRARYVYALPGATDDIIDVWSSFLGTDFDVRTRESAIAAGWFGPMVDAAASGRIGDVVVTSDSTSVVVRTGAEPNASKLLGHHGSLTPAEIYVPRVVCRS